MGGCRCTYRTCKSATKSTEGLHFFHYPVKNRDRCSQWIKNAERPYFNTLPDDQLRNKVICGLHFEDYNFTNSNHNRLNHDAVPTLNIGCEDDSATKSKKEIELYPTNTDHTTFILQTDHLQSGTTRSNVEILPTIDLSTESQPNNLESEVYIINPSFIEAAFYGTNPNSKGSYIHDSDMELHEQQKTSDQVDSTEYVEPGDKIFPEQTEEYILPNHPNEEAFAANGNTIMVVECNEPVRIPTPEHIFIKEVSTSTKKSSSTSEPKHICDLNLGTDAFESSNTSIPENPDKAVLSSKLGATNHKSKGVLMNTTNVLKNTSIKKPRKELYKQKIKLRKEKYIQMYKRKLSKPFLGAMLLELFGYTGNLTSYEKKFVNILRCDPALASAFVMQLGCFSHDLKNLSKLWQ